MWRCAQDYGLSREDLDFVFSVTQFKSKADWAADPMKVRQLPSWLNMLGCAAISTGICSCSMDNVPQ